ncbi:MAG: spore coat associated protein CotJA [Lachnospiraceae bacterium]|nr:spore coat associated protein CotJA [Lachnospiraceae bacterium]
MNSDCKKRIIPDSGLDCGFLEEPYQPSLAMAYVPCQKFEELFSVSESMSRGTVFPGLYKPFEKGACQIHESKV